MNEPTETPEKKSRHRSPNYPAIGLREAVDRVRRLYDADKRAGARLEAAVKHLGFSSANGSAMVVVSALKKFGLIEEANDRLIPTQRAVEILAYPTTDSRHVEAVREAALKPDIYRQLFDRFSEGGSLPSDETFKAELEAEMGFNPNAIRGFITDFKETLVYAGLMNEDELSLAIEVPPVVRTEIETPPKKELSASEQLAIKAAKNIADAQSQISTPVGKTEDGTPVFAHVRFSGTISREYVISLKKYLDYLEGTL